jgi:hypothetical protein
MDETKLALLLLVVGSLVAGAKLFHVISTTDNGGVLALSVAGLSWIPIVFMFSALHIRDVLESTNVLQKLGYTIVALLGSAMVGVFSDRVAGALNPDAYSPPDEMGIGCTHGILGAFNLMAMAVAWRLLT